MFIFKLFVKQLIKILILFLNLLDKDEAFKINERFYRKIDKSEACRSLPNSKTSR